MQLNSTEFQHPYIGIASLFSFHNVEWKISVVLSRDGLTSNSLLAKLTSVSQSVKVPDKDRTRALGYINAFYVSLVAQTINDQQ